MIIRNDDVSVDTNLEHFKKFCELCDKYGVELVHAITPIGRTHGIEKSMTNEEILAYSGKSLIFDNKPLVEYLAKRHYHYGDVFAVHGLFHTHNVTANEQEAALGILQMIAGIDVRHSVWPFNEQGEVINWLSYVENNPRIEDYLPGMPLEKEVSDSPILYLHDWRFDGSWYTLDQLEETFIRFKNAKAKKTNN